MIRTFLLLLLLFAVASSIDAAFTHIAQWKLDTIERTFAGTCFRPGPRSSAAPPCDNATLKAFLYVHISNGRGAGLSIAYYDPTDGSLLGDASWANWDSVTLPVTVCMSGRIEALDDAYTTTCRFAVADNDHESPSSHVGECFVSRAQERVTDGCYLPPVHRGGFWLDDSTSGILTILGLVVVLPGMAFGAYRWYFSRKLKLGEGQHKLVTLSGSVNHGEVRSEEAQAAS